MADGTAEFGRIAAAGLVWGRIAEIADDGAILVLVDGAEAPAPALSLVEIFPGDVGARVGLTTAPDADGAAMSVILGLLRDRAEAAPRRVERDGETVAISARESLVLTCGKASIRMRADGRITIRGGHLVSQASGANRIRGGSVHFN